MWVNLRKILEVKVNQLKIKKEFEILQAMDGWQKISQNIEKKYNHKLKCLSFGRGILAVGCDSSVLANELQIKEKDFLNNLENILNKKLVKKIRFVCC